MGRTFRPASMDIQQPLVQGPARAKSRGRSTVPSASARASSASSGETATTDQRTSRHGRDPRREARAQSGEPRRRSTTPRGAFKRQASGSSGGEGRPDYRLDHVSVSSDERGPGTITPYRPVAGDILTLQTDDDRF